MGVSLDQVKKWSNRGHLLEYLESSDTKIMTCTPVMCGRDRETTNMVKMNFMGFHLNISRDVSFFFWGGGGGGGEEGFFGPPS